MATHTLCRRGGSHVSAVLTETVGCSYAAATTRRSATLRPSTVFVARSFSTARPAAALFDGLRNTLSQTFQGVLDRGRQATGQKTSVDKKIEALADETLPHPSKTLARQRRKRWGALHHVYDPETNSVVERVTEHKYSTARFRISPRKLTVLAHQIGGGKPVDYSILQMQFSQKKAARRIKSTLVLARDHAIAKGLNPARLVVAEAFVGKGKTHKRIDIKGRGRFGERRSHESHLSVILREGKTWQQREAELMEKEKRRVRSIGTGGVVRSNRPFINQHQRPAWTW